MDGSPDELEKVIGRVRDVLRVKVVRDDGGKVKQVRVLTSDSRTAQKIARDVTTALRSQGEDISPEDIHIAQMTNEEWSALAGGRLRLEGVSFETRSSSAECRVLLGLGDKLISGSAKGPLSSRESLKIVAKATLEAVAAAIDPCPEMSLEGVGTISIAGVETVVVLVSGLGPDGVEYFSGSCPVRVDHKDATARATLSAINRKFALLLKGEEP